MLCFEFSWLEAMKNPPSLSFLESGHTWRTCISSFGHKQSLWKQVDSRWMTPPSVFVLLEETTKSLWWGGEDLLSMKDPGFSFLLSTPAICLHFFQDANSTHWLHQPSVALVIPAAMLRKWHLHKRSNICRVINYISFAQNFQTMLYKIGLPDLHSPVCGTHNEWTRCTETFELVSWRWHVIESFSGLFTLLHF